MKKSELAVPTFTPGSTVRLVSRDKEAGVYDRPTRPDVEMRTWTPESTGKEVIEVRWVNPAGKFRPSDVATLLEVTRNEEGEFARVLVGSVVGWVSADLLEVAP